jgi:hypothetical protein
VRKMLLLPGMLLLLGCATTKTVEVPVMPEPCRVPAFPELPAEASPFTPTGIALTAAWMVSVDEWRTAVLECPFIQTDAGPDIRDSLDGDPFLKTR